MNNENKSKFNLGCLNIRSRFILVMRRGCEVEWAFIELGTFWGGYDTNKANKSHIYDINYYKWKKEKKE